MSSPNKASPRASALATNSQQQQQQHSVLDISELPSLKQDGMTIAEEAKVRRQTCRFLDKAGRSLQLNRVAIATAMVFFHRFYAKYSFQAQDRFEVAVACLLLAAKTEESPKKLNTVLDECYKLKSRNESSLDPKSEEFVKLKEQVLRLERVILHTIGFELSVDHPYRFLSEQVSLLVQHPLTDAKPKSSQGGTTSSSQQQQQQQHYLGLILPEAIKFASDSLLTSLCLQFDPEHIAATCVYLAAHMAQVQPVPPETWWDLLPACLRETDTAATTTAVKADGDMKNKQGDGDEKGGSNTANHPAVRILASMARQIMVVTDERSTPTEKQSLETIQFALDELQPPPSAAATTITATDALPQAKRPRTH